MLVKIKKLDEKAVVPKYSHRGDAGLDITATSYSFENNRHVYGTSLAIEIPDGFVGLIFPRSSICKQDLRLTNSVGVIDSNFRGEIKFQFENAGFGLVQNISGALEVDLLTPPKIYKVGERIGQIIIVPYPKIEFKEVKELSSTKRGQGGFGSSGV